MWPCEAEGCAPTTSAAKPPLILNISAPHGNGSEAGRNVVEDVGANLGAVERNVNATSLSAVLPPLRASVIWFERPSSCAQRRSCLKLEGLLIPRR